MNTDDHTVLSGPTSSEPHFSNFSVESGDSLHTVSMKTYGRSTSHTREKIARANYGAFPLTPGTTLRIPA